MRKLLKCLVIALLLLGCERKEEIPQDIGLQFYSLRNQFEEDIPGTLELISSWGIHTIEGGESYGMPQKEFLDLLEENQLDVVSVGAAYEELLSDPQMAVERAKSYGARYVMVPWIPHTENQFNFEDTQKAVELFNRTGKILSEEGLHLVYHPHGYEFKPHAEGNLMDYMLQNAEDFDFEMDVYWFTHGGADPLEYLNTYPDKFKLMHLKDMEKGVQGNTTGHEDVETNVVLGTGQIDIEDLVLRARELGVEYMFIEDESSRVVEQVPKSLEFLSNLN